MDAKLVLTNKHLERILQLLREQKAKASKEQFAKLLAPSTAPKGDPIEQNPNASSIQTIFQKHLMKSLGTYEDYLKVRFSRITQITNFELANAPIINIG